VGAHTSSYAAKSGPVRVLGGRLWRVACGVWREACGVWHVVGGMRRVVYSEWRVVWRGVCGVRERGVWGVWWQMNDASRQCTW